MTLSITHSANHNSDQHGESLFSWVPRTIQKTNLHYHHTHLAYTVGEQSILGVIGLIDHNPLVALDRDAPVYYGSL